MSASFKHALGAYLVLLVVAWLLLAYPVLPLWENLQSERQQTQDAQSAIDEHRQKTDSQRTVNAALKHKLEALALLGDMIVASPEQATHDFQSAVKAVLIQRGAEVKRLIPTRREVQADLSEISLEVTFQARPETIQWALEDLTNRGSRAQVELLSVRKTDVSSRFNGASQGIVLEGRLIVTMLSAPASLVTLTGNAIEPISQIKNGDALLPLPLPAAGPNRLASLFDASARSKFTSPDINDYRVAAITVTERNQIAVIVEKSSGKTFRLKQGDFLYAWKVAKIEPSKVSLIVGDLVGELFLN